MSFTFNSRDDVAKESPEWCQGKATVLISTVKDGDESGDSGSTLDIVNFRFRAKP